MLDGRPKTMSWIQIALLLVVVWLFVQLSLSLPRITAPWPVWVAGLVVAIAVLILVGGAHLQIGSAEIETDELVAAIDSIPRPSTDRRWVGDVVVLGDRLETWVVRDCLSADDLATAAFVPEAHRPVRATFALLETD